MPKSLYLATYGWQMNEWDWKSGASHNTEFADK